MEKIQIPIKQLTAKLVMSLLSNLSSEVFNGDLLNFTISAYSFHVHSKIKINKLKKNNQTILLAIYKISIIIYLKF